MPFDRRKIFRGTRGFCIGHISPEAYEGGMIGLIEDGDTIKIDLEKSTLDVVMDEVEYTKRRENFETLKKQVDGYLSKYVKLVSSADKGAICS